MSSAFQKKNEENCIKSHAESILFICNISFLFALTWIKTKWALCTLSSPRLRFCKHRFVVCHHPWRLKKKKKKAALVLLWPNTLFTLVQQQQKQRRFVLLLPRNLTSNLESERAKEKIHCSFRKPVWIETLLQN